MFRGSSVYRCSEQSHLKVGWEICQPTEGEQCTHSANHSSKAFVFFALHHKSGKVLPLTMFKPQTIFSPLYDWLWKGGVLLRKVIKLLDLVPQIPLLRCFPKRMICNRRITKCGQNWKCYCVVLKVMDGQQPLAFNLEELWSSRVPDAFFKTTTTLFEAQTSWSANFASLSHFMPLVAVTVH